MTLAPLSAGRDDRGVSSPAWWRVDDSATAELMRHFYPGMLQQRLPAAAALQAAQRAMAAHTNWASR